MTALALLFAAICATHPCQPPPPLTLYGSGQATFYGDGIFDQVIINRGLVVPYDVIGFAALLEPEHIGRRVWIRWPDGTLDGPYLSSDCANAAHRGDLIERGWIVDVDRATARLHGMAAPTLVTVYLEVKHESNQN